VKARAMGRRRDEHGYPAVQTDAALDAIAHLKMTEHDFRQLAAACADQAGLPVRVREQIERLLGLVP